MYWLANFDWPLAAILLSEPHGMLGGVSKCGQVLALAMFKSGCSAPYGRYFTKFGVRPKNVVVIVVS